MEHRDKHARTRVAVALASAFGLHSMPMGVSRPAMMGSRPSGASGGGSKKFVYQERPPEATAAQANQSTGGFDKIVRSDVVEYQVHDNNGIRFCPPTWENPKHWALELHVHYNIGPDGNTYLCPALMKDVFARIGLELPDHVKDGRCAACDERLQAVEASEEDYVKALKPSKRYGAWVVDRKEEDKFVLFWSYAASIDKDINGRLQGKRGGVLKIDHPEEGYDVLFKREGEKKKSKYVGIDIERDSGPIFSDAAKQEKVIDYILDNPIPAVLNFYPYDYIAKQLTGGAPHNDDAGGGEQREQQQTQEPASTRPRVGAAASPAATTSGRPRVGQPASAPAEESGPVIADAPSWDEAHEMPIDDLYGFADEAKIVFPEDREFKSETEVRDFVCEQAGIKPPAKAEPEPPPPAATGSWRDRLHKRG